MNINGAFLHLVLNHIPFIVPLVGAGVLAVGGCFALRQTELTGLWVLVLGAVGVIPTYLTGEPAEKVVQNYPNVTHSSIETHQQAALYALIATLILGSLALLNIWQARQGKKISRAGIIIVLLLSLLTSVIVARTAHLGGLIRHEEVERGEFK